MHPFEEKARERLRDSADLKRRCADELAPAIGHAGQLLAECIASGGKILCLGNGGSAADAQHFAAELTGRFVRDRRALPAIALTTDTSALTSIANDYGFEQIFARQVEALGQPGDCLIAISTSGNSPNVMKALESARRRQMRCIGLSGETGGAMKDSCDLCLLVPHKTTAYIQETHIAILHAWCAMIDECAGEAS